MRFARFVSSALLLGYVAAAEESAVISLTGLDFNRIVDAEPLVLVEFFAPWCGHCKALAPHYETAATVLKANHIKLAKVDCVDQPDLCQSQGVQGYPTLKVFRNGKPTDYAGTRKANGIISYMVKQSLPAVREVTVANHDEFKASENMVIIAYAASSTDAPAPVFSQVAEKHRDDYLFGFSTDEAVIAAAGITPPAVVVYRKFDEPRLDFPKAKFTAKELEAFITENSYPLVDEMGADNYARYAQAGRPIAYLFIEPSDERHAEYVEALRPAAQKYKGRINFVHIDAVRYVAHAQSLNLPSDKWPAFAIQSLESQLKYTLESNDITADVLTNFADLFIAGKLKPKPRSQPVPVTQDKGVYVLVGSEFDEVVFDDTKDVFIDMYAVWCGHCKRLEPTWTALGDKYAALKDRITIAKIEATENDVPVKISGFPTLKFKKAGTREFIDYEGDRSLGALVKFVEKHAANPLDASVPFEVAQPSDGRVQQEFHD